MLGLEEREAYTILGLMDVGDLERGLSADEMALRNRIFREMPAVAHYMAEGHFEDAVTRNCLLLDHRVHELSDSLDCLASLRRKLRAHPTKQNQDAEAKLDEQYEQAVQEFHETKNRVFSRVVCAVRDGWVF
jgi:hypothetical protein